jgi:hypothetical protein
MIVINYISNFFVLASSSPKANTGTDDSLEKLLLQIFISILSGALGTVGTIMFTRKETKKKLYFDITYQKLFPSVYMPLIAEYQRVINLETQQKKAVLRTADIEKIIFENGVIIQFAPKKIKHLLDTIYSLCSSITNVQQLEQKSEKIKKNLYDLKSELLNEFEEFIK